MQDKYSASPAPSNDLPDAAGVELTPLDEAAIVATSDLVTGSDPVETSAAGGGMPQSSVPGRGHKMDILEETVAELNSQSTQESPLVQWLKGWIDKAAAMAHVAVDKTASSVVPLAQAAVEAKASTVAKAQTYKETAAATKDQWVDEAKTAIQERPLTALAVAAVAGVAISLLLFSASDPDSD